MENENDQDVDLQNNEEESDLELDIEEEEPVREKPKRTPEEQLAYLEGRTQRLRKKLGLVEARKPKAEKTGELDDATLNYLDLKGFNDEEEIKILKQVMSKTGMSARQVVKDDYALSKINTLRAQKAVEDATPSSTKRSGGQVNDVASALARFEQSGQLPEDFALKTAVIDALVEKDNTNKPLWK